MWRNRRSVGRRRFRQAGTRSYNNRNTVFKGRLYFKVRKHLKNCQKYIVHIQIHNTVELLSVNEDILGNLQKSKGGATIRIKFYETLIKGMYTFMRMVLTKLETLA